MALAVAMEEYLQTLGLFAQPQDSEESPPRTAAVLECYRHYSIFQFIVERMGRLYGEIPVCSVWRIHLDRFMVQEKKPDLVFRRIRLPASHVRDINALTRSGGEWYYIVLVMDWTHFRTRSSHATLLVFDLAKQTYTFWDPDWGNMYLPNLKRNTISGYKTYALFANAEKANRARRGYWLLPGFELDEVTNDYLPTQVPLQRLIEVPRAGVCVCHQTHPHPSPHENRPRLAIRFAGHVRLHLSPDGDLLPEVQPRQARFDATRSQQPTSDQSPRGTCVVPPWALPLAPPVVWVEDLGGIGEGGDGAGGRASAHHEVLGEHTGDR
jgi:hypothetical protein